MKNNNNRIKNRVVKKKMNKIMNNKKRLNVKKNLNLKER